MNPIETKNLTRQFRNHEAVIDLNLTVSKGSLCALLGRNGAGKSTTIKMLAGLLEPTSGSSRLRGTDSQKLKPDDWQRIGYVSENQKLYDWMTGAELIAFTKKLYPTWDNDFEKSLIQKFSLPLDRRISKSSLGERRKLSLLLSLAYRPELLLLDEPFGGIDALVKEEFLGGLLELTQQNEWTVLFATNEISEVERLADQVAIIDTGRLQVSESLDQLQQRFRRVEIAAPKPSSFLENGVVGLEQDEQRFAFVHTVFTPEVEAKLHAQFGAANVQTRSMPFKEIFLALARSYQARA